MQPDAPDGTSIRGEGEIGAVRLAPAIGGGARIQQAQARRRRAVPRDVTVAEAQEVNVGEGCIAPQLPPRGRARLVHDHDPDATDVRPRHLRKPYAQVGAVIVPPARQKPARAILQPVEKVRLHPVPGVDDKVRVRYGGPQGCRQVTGALGDVGVGDQQHLHRAILLP